MSDGKALIRQEPLQTLPRFTRSLLAAGRRQTPPCADFAAAFQSACSGECVQCGIRITGEELLIVARTKEPDGLRPRTARLILGYCARNGCDSCFYRLRFDPHPGLNWIEVLTWIESGNEDEEAEVTAANDEETAGSRASRRRLAVRASIGLVIVLMLLLLRQWYIGGRIPFIREPEDFQVDVLPPTAVQPFE